LKIALITDGIWPYVMGGMQKHSYYLCKYLAQNKVNVDLIHFNRSKLDITDLSVFSEEEKNRRSEYAKRQHREGKIDYNKISKTLSNKTLSNEHRKKISEGVKGKNSKLTENDVKLIKLKLKNEPHLSAKNIGDIFGVSKYVIKQIRSNNSWKYVQI